jgi:hypothetical protein
VEKKRGDTPTGSAQFRITGVCGWVVGWIVGDGINRPKAKKTSYYPTLPRKMTLGAGHAREGPCWANHRSADGKTQGRLKLWHGWPVRGNAAALGKVRPLPGLAQGTARRPGTAGTLPSSKKRQERFLKRACDLTIISSHLISDTVMSPVSGR